MHVEQQRKDGVGRGKPLEKGTRRSNQLTRETASVRSSAIGKKERILQEWRAITRGTEKKSKSKLGPSGIALFRIDRKRLDSHEGRRYGGREDTAGGSSKLLQTQKSVREGGGQKPFYSKEEKGLGDQKGALTGTTKQESKFIIINPSRDSMGRWNGESFPPSCRI